MSTSGQDRLRQQWQIQERTGKSAKLWLILRRTVATLLALGLMVAFCFGLYSFWNAPKSYLAYYSANIYDPTSGAPVAFAFGDFEKVASLQNAFTATDLVNPVESSLTKALLDQKLSDLADWASGSKDTLVVFLTAHGRIVKGDAALLCEPSDGDITIALSEVLKKISASAAGTKLLILDAGRDTAGPVDDPKLNTFSKLVEEALTELNDPALWVLCANSSYEQSHVSPKLGRSLFSYAISEGLGGKADAAGGGDGDGEINLDELRNFVRNNVSAWVKGKESTEETQTPKLFNSEEENLSSAELKDRALMVVQPSSSNEASKTVADHHDAEAKDGWAKRLAENTKELVRLDELKRTRERFKRQFGSETNETDEDTQGQPADKAASAGAIATESSVENADSKTGAAPKPDKTAANRNKVAQAWQQIGELESKPFPLRPAELNSPEWSISQRKLLWCDQVANAGLPNDAQESWSRFDDMFAVVEQSIDLVSAQIGPRKLGGDDRITLALIEQGTATDELRNFIAEYDKLLQREAITGGPTTSEALKQKLMALMQPTPKADAPASSEGSALTHDLHLDDYYELKLIGSLGNDPEIDWELLRLMLSTRRLGEQVALNQIPEYENPIDNDAEKAKQLADMTKESPRNNWRQSIETADRMRLEGERLMLDQTVSDWKTLAREKLRDARSVYENAKKITEDAQVAFRERYRVGYQAPDFVRWAQLAHADRTELTAIGALFASLQKLDKLLVTTGNNDFKELRNLQDQIRDFKRRVVTSENDWRIADYLATVLPGPAAEERINLTKRMIELDNDRDYSFATKSSSDIQPDSESNETATGLAHLIETLKSLQQSDSNKLDMTPEDAARHEALAWNGKRFHRALADAPEMEATFLRYAADTYRRSANQVRPANSPALDSLRSPALKFGNVPSEIPLESADNYELTVTVNSTDATPIWLVAQYNEKLLAVESNSTAVIRESKLRQDARDAEYPIHPSKLKEPPAPETLSKGSAVFHLSIKRPTTANTAGKAKLILKAVSANPAVNDYVRREISVNLPGSGTVDIAIADQPAEIWDQKTHELHPLPNKVQNFVFHVLNPAKLAQKVEVSFWVPEKLPAKDRSSRSALLPLGPQKQVDATRILRDFGTLRPFGRAITVDLPASEESVRLNDPTIAPATNLLGLPTDAEGITLRHGLIVQLKSLEKNSDAVTFRHIRILPLRPSSYLTATAHCDRMRRFQIDVKCTNSSIIQDQVLQLEAHSKSFLQPLPAELKADLAGENTVSMYGYLESGKEDITVDVDVDGYPRVFKFVLTSVAEGDYQPRIDPAVEVSVPLPNGPPFAVKAPVKDFPVIVKVDGPPENFGDGGSVVLVSFDQGAKRTPEGDGDSVQTLRSDRAVRVVAKSLSPDGTLSIEGQVGDFHLHLSPKISNQTEPLDLMGWIMTGEQIRAYSDPPVSVLFDGAPPTIDVAFPGIQAKNQRARIIEFGDELVIHVVPIGRDLSGIAKVEATFEKPFVAGEKPEPWPTGVEQSGPDGRKIWVVKLKIDDKVGMGEQWIRVKATDRVGNESFPLREQINIVPKVAPPKPIAAGKKPPVPITNDVPIQVLWGAEPIPAKVNLEPAAGVPKPQAETGNDGRYTFTKVPPGKYTLTVLTTEARQNRYRRGQQEITVPKPPEKVALIKVGVK